MQPRALVTGGGGYVGGRLCTAILERGYTVTAVDVHFQDAEDQDGIRKVKVPCMQMKCDIPSL
jgi:nucleoside-diphosphate-sugar epimerase